MLQRLRLINFQAHERRDINLSATITTFVGPSDRGKTAIWRALKWAMLGQQIAAEDIIRHGADKCIVGILIDGVTLIRQRNATTSTYQLGKKKYKACGRSLPNEIRDFVNVSEVNFHNQLDPHFWITLTPGDLARRLNEITGLELADRVLANIAGRRRKLRAAAEVIEERLKKAKQKQEDLAYVVTLDKDLKELERIQNEKLAKQHAISRLYARISECEKLSTQFVVPSIDGLTQDLQRLQTAHNRHKTLRQRCETIQALHGRTQELERILDSKKQQIDELTKGRCPICGGPLKK